MNLRIVFKFKDCKLQFYEKRRLVSYFSVNPCTPASRWRRLLKLKRKKINSFKIIIGFFFTPPLFLATKVAISFVYYSPKTTKYTQKPKSLQESTNRASERVPFSTSYLQLALTHARNSRIKKGLIIEVYLEYSQELHESHNVSLLADEKKINVCGNVLSNYCERIRCKYNISIGQVKKISSNTTYMKKKIDMYSIIETFNYILILD